MVETFTVRPQEFLQMPQNRALSRFCNDSSLLIGVVPLAVSRSQVSPAESVLRLQGAEGLLSGLGRLHGPPVYMLRSCRHLLASVT